MKNYLVFDVGNEKMLMFTSEVLSIVKGETNKVTVFLHRANPTRYEVDNTFEDIIKQLEQ